MRRRASSSVSWARIRCQPSGTEEATRTGLPGASLDAAARMAAATSASLAERTSWSAASESVSAHSVPLSGMQSTSEASTTVSGTRRFREVTSRCTPVG